MSHSARPIVEDEPLIQVLAVDAFLEEGFEGVRRLRARRSPNSIKSWLPESTTECMASLSMAERHIGSRNQRYVSSGISRSVVGRLEGIGGTAMERRRWTWMANRRLAASALLFWSAAGAASACTLCHSPTAMGVRHLLLHHDLARNATAVAAPIAVLLLAILVAAWEPREHPRPWT